MKTKTEKKEGFESISGSSFHRPGYYFHPDEDFREDLEWGKSKLQESFQINSQNKSAESLITKG